MPDWVSEGSRSTCRHCGGQVVWTRSRKPSEPKAPNFYGYGSNWWHAPGKKYVFEEFGFDEKRSRYYQHDYITVSPFGPLFRACPDPDWLSRKGYGSKNQAQPSTFCDESTENTSHCHRPVKDEELFMCGLHARHKRSEMLRTEQWSVRNDLNDHIEYELKPIIDHLNEFWQLEARMERSPGLGPFLSMWSGKIVVDPVRLMEILGDKVEEF